MPISGSLLQRAIIVVLDNFTNISLSHVLSLRFSQDLYALVSQVAPRKQQVYDLLKRAEDSGNLALLLRYLADERPDVLELALLYNEVKASTGYSPPAPNPNWSSQMASSDKEDNRKVDKPVGSHSSRSVLTGRDVERLSNALRSGYTREELRRLLRTCMNEDFDTLVSDKAYSYQSFEIVEWALRQDRIVELLNCAHEGNGSNREFRALLSELIEPAQTSSSAVRDSLASHTEAISANSYQVFLAYSRKDLEVMRKLRADLLRAGISIWVDDWDLEPGTLLWQRAIQDALSHSHCVVALMSPNASKSEWVNNEIMLAKKRKIRIFPALVCGDEEDALPLSLLSIQYVDIRSDYLGGVTGQLIPALLKYLKNRPAELASPNIIENVNSPNSERLNISDTSLKPKGKEVVSADTLYARFPTVIPSRETSSTTQVDIAWITIPAGEFVMGSDRDPRAFDDEKPQHRIFLPEYQISKYPITNMQYAEFALSSGYKLPKHWVDGIFPQGHDAHPVVNVSWHDANAFCGWLSKTIHRSVLLPSEAEWEKAARGPAGFVSPWGDISPSDAFCNFANNVGSTTPVDKYAKGASIYGVMDMVGNVWEWTRTLWGQDAKMPTFQYPYVASDGRERVDAQNSVLRVVKGGALDSDVRYIRCASRGRSLPYFVVRYFGFRIIRPVLPPEN